MNIETKIGNLTILATLTDATEAEFVGDFYANIPYSAIDLWTDHYNDGAVEEYERDDETPHEIVSYSNADALIKLLRGLSELPENTLTFEYFGNPYWFFHDLQHVKNDAEVSEHNVELYVDEHREESALLNGAIEARKAGVKLSRIVKALVEASKEYIERWKNETNALDEFLDSLEK